jgi:long-chain acyl-CoA synthetase
VSAYPDPLVLERPWVAAYPPGVPPTYDLPKVVLGRFIDDAARDFGDRTALITSTGAVDHATFRDRVDAVATVLGELGLRAGDRALVLLPNHETTPVVLFALWRLGAIAVPLPPDLGIDALEAVAADARPAAAIGDADTLHAMAGQRGLLPPLGVAVDGREWEQPRGLARLRRRRPAETRDGLSRLGPLVADLATRRSVPASPMPDDPAVIAYGPGPRRPRGAVLTHANLVANAFQARLWIPDVQAGKERLLTADPLHELPALTLGLLTGVLAAATICLLDDPDAHELAAAIDREQPTLLFARPARLADLVSHAPARRDLSSLRVCVTAGGPLDPHVAAELEKRTAGARVREGYGLREASALTHAQPVYGRAAAQTMGLPVTDTVAVVVDPEDPRTILEPGEPGMLLVAGPQVASGYWERPEETAATFRGPWLVTGDVVFVTDEGVFHHVGRVDELLRRGGALVAPRRVEEVLERHADVARAGAAVLDGPTLVAAVTRRRRHRVAVDELMAHCRAHLDPPAVPDRIEVVDAVPMTSTGGVARDELRHQLSGRTT